MAHKFEWPIFITDYVKLVRIKNKLQLSVAISTELLRIVASALWQLKFLALALYEVFKDNGINFLHFNVYVVYVYVCRWSVAKRQRRRGNESETKWWQKQQQQRQLRQLHAMNYVDHLHACHFSLLENFMRWLKMQDRA